MLAASPRSTRTPGKSADADADAQANTLAARGYSRKVASESTAPGVTSVVPTRGGRASPVAHVTAGPASAAAESSKSPSAQPKRGPTRSQLERSVAVTSALSSSRPVVGTNASITMPMDAEIPSVPRPTTPGATGKSGTFNTTAVPS